MSFQFSSSKNSGNMGKVVQSKRKSGNLIGSKGGSIQSVAFCFMSKKNEEVSNWMKVELVILKFQNMDMAKPGAFIKCWKPIRYCELERT